jgi:uncharacterized membrane protein
LVSRGLAGFGRPAPALAGPRGIRLAESVRIHRPPHDVYDFWRNLTNVPRFMSHIERVDLRSPTRSHWVARGPAGVTVEWDADVINERRPDLIGWQSIGKADLLSAGSVRFVELADGGTQLDVVLQYDPPAGRVGAGIAGLLGLSPAAVLREDLRRLKVMLEGEGRLRLSETV